MIRFYGTAATNLSRYYGLDGSIVDAFGRIRISDPHTLFDSKNIFNDADLPDTVENLPIFFSNEQISGSGTSTAYLPNKDEQVLYVSADTAGKRARQTKMRFNYRSGKSQLAFLSMNMNGYQSGIKKRIGLFDDESGIYLQLDGSGASFGIRDNTSGVVDDSNLVHSSEWNIDKFDGGGFVDTELDVNPLLKKTANWNKTQILAIDYEWLGVGRVRVGFVIDGKIFYMHEFHNANLKDSVYMSSPNLPIRVEIENDGSGPASSISSICSTVISEGGAQDLGMVRYKSTEGTHLATSTEDIEYALLAMKVKDNYKGASVKLLSVATQLHTASSKLEWFVVLNPTVAGTLNFVNEPQSAVAIAKGTTANTMTGGYKFVGGFLEAGGNQTGAAGSTEKGIDTAILPGFDLNDNPDIIVLGVRPIAGSSAVSVEGALTWRELT